MTPPLDLEHQSERHYHDLQENRHGKNSANCYRFLTRLLLTWGVEYRGIQPVANEDRPDTRFKKIFFIWLSSNCNILSFSSGTLGPIVFGLGLRDACLVILFFNILCCAAPAYLTTWGPKLGMRQMIISRYSFGYYGVIIPCIVNLMVMIGFSVLNCIVGGQALASVANGKLSWTVGVVIVGVISLVLVSFCGIEVLNWYERLAWIPVEPATASAILNFASTIAGFVITYFSLSSDFTSYFKQDAPSWRIFIYSYLGFILPIVTLQCLGAAVSIVATSVPAWSSGYVGGNVGGLLETMLRLAKCFGKFLTVLLSLSAADNMAATFYSISLNMQIFIPPLVAVPRYMFSIVATAIVIPLSSVGATRFYDALTNFLGLISYWASAFAAIVLVEHLVFRKNDPDAYDAEVWNVPNRLPPGIAALAAGILSFGLVIPCMDQAWFVGPIAKTTGDIGFEVAFGISGLLYTPFRTLEIKLLRPL